MIIWTLENKRYFAILCMLSVSYPPNRYIATQLLGDQGDACDADRPNDAESCRLLCRYLCIAWLGAQAEALEFWQVFWRIAVATSYEEVLHSGNICSEHVLAIACIKKEILQYLIFADRVRVLPNVQVPQLYHWLKL